MKEDKNTSIGNEPIGNESTDTLLTIFDDMVIIDLDRYITKNLLDWIKEPLDTLYMKGSMKPFITEYDILSRSVVYQGGKIIKSLDDILNNEYNLPIVSVIPSITIGSREKLLIDPNGAKDLKNILFRDMWRKMGLKHHFDIYNMLHSFIRYILSVGRPIGYPDLLLNKDPIRYLKEEIFVDADKANDSIIDILFDELAPLAEIVEDISLSYPAKITSTHLHGSRVIIKTHCDFRIYRYTKALQDKE